MPEMTTDEYRGFIASGIRTGKLVTVRQDGRPHVVPIWFVLDGEDLLSATSRTSVKGKVIPRDRRVSPCVDDEDPPYAFALIEGATTITKDPDDLLHWSIRIATRYVGEKQAEYFGRRNAVKSEMLVRLAPTKVVAAYNVAGE